MTFAQRVAPFPFQYLFFFLHLGLSVATAKILMSQKMETQLFSIRFSDTTNVDIPSDLAHVWWKFFFFLLSRTSQRERGRFDTTIPMGSHTMRGLTHFILFTFMDSSFGLRDGRKSTGILDYMYILTIRINQLDSPTWYRSAVLRIFIKRLLIYWHMNHTIYQPNLSQ